MKTLDVAAKEVLLVFDGRLNLGSVDRLVLADLRAALQDRVSGGECDLRLEAWLRQEDRGDLARADLSIGFRAGYASAEEYNVTATAAEINEHLAAGAARWAIERATLRIALERLLAVVEHRVDHSKCPDGQNCPEPELAAKEAHDALDGHASDEPGLPGRRASPTPEEK